MSSKDIRGFSDPKGSWNTICMSRRNSRNGARGTSVMSTTSPSRVRKLISPEVGSIPRSMHLERVVLPQPLSPTIACVSPCLTAKLTSSTAFTAPIIRLVIPRVIGKC